MTSEHESLVAGVSNFRNFQVDVREFITDYKARDDERKDLVLSQQEVVKATLEAHSAQQARKDNLRTTIIALIGVLIAIVELFKH
jgi:hypothetical protein